MAPRFFVGESTGTSSPSVTLPAGGTWLTQVVVLGQEDAPEGHFVNGATISDSDDDSRVATGARSYAGGTTLTMTSSESSEEITMSVMAIRTDC